MIRHTVLFQFKPGFPPADRQAWIDGLNNMAGKIPACSASAMARTS
jgi:hypothetical protein